MCGRFALPMEVSEIVEPFGARPAVAGADALAMPSYNICPTQGVLAIRSGAEGREAVAMRWGFLPHWYKSPTDGPLLINARSETIAEKPAFRTACRERRCLIPATGFYEWQATGEKGAPKTPFYFAPAQGGPFAFAGIWQGWRDPEGVEIETCGIVTCDANAALAPIHHRMPVVIAPEDWPLWLGEAGKGAAVLMRPAPEDFFAFHAVGRSVSNARSDGPQLVLPVA